MVVYSAKVYKKIKSIVRMGLKNVRTVIDIK